MSPSFSFILENIVYLELLRRDYKVTVGRTGDKEIDFVCDKSGEKLYVQVLFAFFHHICKPFHLSRVIVGTSKCPFRSADRQRDCISWIF